jgi:hypothetical protein
MAGRYLVMRQCGSANSRRAASNSMALRYRSAENGAWQDAIVVDIQIHGVSEPTRRTLSAEAEMRGESLQEYLLDVLDREAHDRDNRRLGWSAGQGNEAHPVDFVAVVSPGPQAREAQLAHGS